MAKAATLVTRVTEVLAAERLRLINPLVYSNMDLLADDRFRRLLLWYNAARDYDQAAVWLGQYGPDTFLFGDSPFPLVSEGQIVDEQAPPDEYDRANIFERMMLRAAEASSVDRPCLLACSQGEWTWGHWLLDMLPKIVMAENVAPKRFTFAVPASITRPELNPRHVASVMESLAAYGIDRGRLLPIHPGKFYRFKNLYDVIGIRSDGMHPGVIAVMQSMVNVPTVPRRQLTAIMRGSGDHRRIVNANEIDAGLTRAKAVRIDPSSASFAEQVQAFRDSDTIVGDMGSNLAAVIYARPETGIVTLAPSGWRDYFFIPTFQRKEIYHADVRGVAASRTSGAISHAPYLVDPKHFGNGLQTILHQKNVGLPTAAGRLIARAPGPKVWELRFGMRGNAVPFQRHGFAPPEVEWTWSLGKYCVLEMPSLTLPEKDYWLEITGVGYAAEPYLVSRPLGVVINDILRWRFEPARKEPSLAASKANSLNLILGKPLLGAIIELRCARAFVRGHGLGMRSDWIRA